MNKVQLQNGIVLVLYVSDTSCIYIKLVYNTGRSLQTTIYSPLVSKVAYVGVIHNNYTCFILDYIWPSAAILDNIVYSQIRKGL